MPAVLGQECHLLSKQGWWRGESPRYARLARPPITDLVVTQHRNRCTNRDARGRNGRGRTTTPLGIVRCAAANNDRAHRQQQHDATNDITTEGRTGSTPARSFQGEAYFRFRRAIASFACWKRWTARVSFLRPRDSDQRSETARRITVAALSLSRFGTTQKHGTTVLNTSGARFCSISHTCGVVRVAPARNKTWGQPWPRKENPTCHHVDTRQESADD